MTESRKRVILAANEYLDGFTTANEFMHRLFDIFVEGESSLESTIEEWGWLAQAIDNHKYL